MICLLATVALSQQPALFRFIERSDASFACEAQKPRTFEARQIEVWKLTSQTWQGRAWTHQLEIHQPERLDAKGTAVLWITGDRGSTDPDAKLARRVADVGGMPVAVLYDVPNQPLFEKLREDALIAYTFGKFLESKDENWPLLLPMVKSAVAAMDAICNETKSGSNPIKRFVVAGESKRGWTTLLTAAYDKRVLAEAPMAFDFVDFGEQLRKQRSEWGHLSPMFAAYGELSPEEVIGTELGKVLVSMVDPAAYMTRLHKPKLIVRGSNDPFWTADALSVYWDKLPGGKLACILPNAGHVVSTEVQAQTDLGVFCRLVAGDASFPLFHGTWSRNNAGDWTYKAVAPGSKTIRLWICSQKDSEFHKEKFVIAAVGQNALTVPRSPYPTATFVESSFQIGSETFTLTSVPRVFPPASSAP